MNRHRITHKEDTEVKDLPSMMPAFNVLINYV